MLEDGKFRVLGRRRGTIDGDGIHGSCHKWMPERHMDGGMESGYGKSIRP